MATTLLPNREHSAPLTERRRRSRLSGDTLGWILPAQPRLALHLPDDEQAWEVRVYDVSRFGVGFSSTQPLDLGGEHRIRIGRGPARRARLIRVAACRESEAGLFAIGAEFIDLGTKDLARAG